MSVRAAARQAVVTASPPKAPSQGVWAQVDALVEKFEATKKGLKELGNESKCGTRPSTLNAVHWVAKCLRRDCDDRELIGTAAELPALMVAHSAVHEKANAKERAEKKAAKAAERKAAAGGR